MSRARQGKMKALIIVDIQKYFCPGGALPVKGGHEVVPLINDMQGKFNLILSTPDWHPPDHMSFASNHGKKGGKVVELEGQEQVLWPDYCVKYTALDAVSLGVKAAVVEDACRGINLADEDKKDFFS